MKDVMLPMAQLAELIKVQLEGEGVAHLPVTGGSMLPMLRHRRDTVILSRPESLSSGDIILYRRENGSYILHRIVSVRKDGSFLCSGDNQWEKETVWKEQVLAKVTGFCRTGKTYSVTHAGYRLYMRLWVGLFPVRRPILKARRCLGCLRRAEKKKRGQDPQNIRRNE